MSTDATWEPTIVPGRGRDSRFERRRHEMQETWGEAWALYDAGDREGALERFLDANDDGMKFPVDDARSRCFLTGETALGYARVPFTDWDADVAISHGRDEQRPTALDRWVGDWSNGASGERRPVRPAGLVTVRNDVPMLRLHAVKGAARPGPEGPMQRIGALENGAWVEFDVQRDGSILLRKFTPDVSGPQPVAD